MLLVSGIALALSAWPVAESADDRRIVVESARLPSGETVDLLILDGIITSIGEVELTPGDVLVRARGGEVIAGRRRVLDKIPEWSELVDGPAVGLTSVVLPWGAIDRTWAEGRRRGAAWIGPRLAAAVEADSAPRISVGFPAELLVLDPESRAINQAIVGDRVLRRADLETRREMLANARRRLSELVAPEPGFRGLRLEAAGLPIGRVDLSFDGRSVTERLVAPHAIVRSWELRDEPDGWSAVLREHGLVVATVRGEPSGVTAEAAEGKRIELKGVSGKPSPDLAASIAAAAVALGGLSQGDVLKIPTIDLEVGPEGLTVQPDELSFRRLLPTELPFPLWPGERGFGMTSTLGREGLFVVGADGFPTRVWETGPAGDVEWVGRPLTGSGTHAGGWESAGSATKPP